MRYDPQSIHTDPEAALNGPFKGLIASGWMTAGLMMRLYCQHYLSAVASLASPGIDELRWLRPVRPGDTLSIRVTVKDARRSLDFVHDQLENGRRFRVLNIADDVTRECLASVPDTSISGVWVVRELSALVAQRGRPGMIVSDNATELTSNAVLK